MEKVLYGNSFNPTSRNLTVNDVVEVEKERIVSIWNVTKAGAVINRWDAAPDAVTVSANVITLSEDVCRGMESTDTIIVVYDVPEVRRSTLMQNQTLTQSGNSAVILAKHYSKTSLCCVVSSVSGTLPSLTLSITGVDGFDNEKALATSNAITTTGTYWLDADLGIFEEFKVVWTISGTTPSFTVSMFLTLKV